MDVLCIDAAELARRLDVSLRHVRRMAANGALGPPGVRLGRSLRYPVHEVEAWIRSGCPERRAWLAMRRPLKEGKDVG